MEAYKENGEICIETFICDECGDKTHNGWKTVITIPCKSPFPNNYPMIHKQAYEVCHCCANGPFAKIYEDVEKP